MEKKQKEDNFIKVTYEIAKNAENPENPETVETDKTAEAAETEKSVEADKAEDADELIDDENFKSDRNHCGSRKCFSYRDGYCYCLQDTDFKGRGCPFFKTRKQVEDEMEKLAKDKAEDSFDVFLDANADFMKELAALDAEAARIEKGGVLATPRSTDDQDSKGTVAASVIDDKDDDGWEDEEEGGEMTYGKEKG